MMLFILILGLVVGHFLNVCICKYCEIKLHIQHLIKIANLILYVLLFYKFYFTIEFFCYAFLLSLLLIVFVIDFKKNIIPNKIILIGFISILILKIVESFYFLSFEPLLKSVLGLVTGAFPLLIIILVSRGGMGAGDMKLMGVIGMWFGFENTYLILFISIISAGAVSTILILVKKIYKKSRIKIDRKSSIAFAPFISTSAFICLMWSQTLVDFLFLNQRM